MQVFSGYVVLEAVTLITSDALDYLGRAQRTGVGQGRDVRRELRPQPPAHPLDGRGRRGVGHRRHPLACTSLVNLFVVHHELDLSVARLFRHVAFVLAITFAMSAVVFSMLPFVSGPISLVGVVLLGGAVWAGLATVSGLLDVSRVANVLGS